MLEGLFSVLDARRLVGGYEFLRRERGNGGELVYRSINFYVCSFAMHAEELRNDLAVSGLDETDLYFMNGEERAEALEGAGLDPYDYDDYDWWALSSNVVVPTSRNRRLPLVSPLPLVRAIALGEGLAPGEEGIQRGEPVGFRGITVHPLGNEVGYGHLLKILAHLEAFGRRGEPVLNDARPDLHEHAAAGAVPRASRFRRVALLVQEVEVSSDSSVPQMRARGFDVVACAFRHAFVAVRARVVRERLLGGAPSLRRAAKRRLMVCIAAGKGGKGFAPLQKASEAFRFLLLERLGRHLLARAAVLAVYVLDDGPPVLASKSARKGRQGFESTRALELNVEVTMRAVALAAVRRCVALLV